MTTQSPRGAGGEAARRLARRAAVAAAPPLRRVVAERDGLRRERDALRHERDRLRRTASRPGADLDYLFVLTYGRSGSTLLQAILNSIPGVLIRGENRGIVYRLHQFHASAVRDAGWIGPVGARAANPFFGINDYPAGVACTDIRRLLLDTLLRPQPDTRMVGFKEIRWYQDDVDDYVAFVRDVFPGARFVVNTRRIADVARSGWWADVPDAEQRLAGIEGRLLTIAEKLGECALHLRYDDYVADPARLRALFDWLGADFDEQRVRRVMARRYGPPAATPPTPGSPE